MVPIPLALKVVMSERNWLSVPNVLFWSNQ